MATTPAPSLQGVTARSRAHYHQFLEYLAARQPKLKQLQYYEETWDAEDVPDKPDLLCGGITLLEFINSQFQITFQGQTSRRGFMRPKTAREFLTESYYIQKPTDYKTRILIHHYTLLPDGVPWGLNYSLLHHLACLYEIDPYMYTSHHRPASEPCSEALPSLRKVFKMETDRILCTAQMYYEPMHRPSKTLLVLCGDKPRRGYEEQLLWRTGDLHALPRSILDAGPSAFSWNLTTHTMQFIHILQTERPTEPASTTNFFEALLPLVRICIATEFDFVNTAAQIWYQYKGVMFSVTEYPENPFPETLPAGTSVHAAGLRPGDVPTNNVLADKEENTAPYPESVSQALSKFDYRRHRALELFEGVKLFYPAEGFGPPHPIINDVAYLIKKLDMVAGLLRESVSLHAGLASLEESRAAVAQNARVARITKLGFVFTFAFMPLSLVASIFGMNVNVLTNDGTKWWNVFYGILIAYSLVLPASAYLYPVKAKALIAWVPKCAVKAKASFGAVFHLKAKKSAGSVPGPSGPPPPPPPPPVQMT